MTITLHLSTPISSDATKSYLLHTHPSHNITSHHIYILFTRVCILPPSGIHLLPASFVVGHKPIDALLDAILDGGELVIRKMTSELLIARSLLELSIGLFGVEDDLALEVHGLGNGQSNGLDGDLGGLIDGEGDGIGGVVVAHHPDGQFGQIEGVDELAEGSSGAPNGEGGVVLLGQVALVDEAGDDVAVLDGEVVVRAVDVGGDDGGEVAPVLLGVGAVHGVDEALGVGVSLVGGMGRSVVEHGLVDGVTRLVGEDAGGEEGHELLHLVDAAVLHDVVVDECVLAVELNLLGQVGEQTADLGGEVDDVGGLELGEDGVGVGPYAEVTVLGGKVDPLLVVLLVRLDVHADGLADKAGAPGDHDDVLLPAGGGLLPGLLGGWRLGHGCLQILDA